MLNFFVLFRKTTDNYYKVQYHVSLGWLQILYDLFVCSICGVNRFKLYFLKNIKPFAELYLLRCSTCFLSILSYKSFLYRIFTVLSQCFLLLSGLVQLDFFVASALGHRSGPVSFRRAAGTFRGSSVSSVLDEPWPALDR